LSIRDYQRYWKEASEAVTVEGSKFADNPAPMDIDSSSAAAAASSSSGRQPRQAKAAASHALHEMNAKKRKVPSSRTMRKREMKDTLNAMLTDVLNELRANLEDRSAAPHGVTPVQVMNDRAYLSCFCICHVLVWKTLTSSSQMTSLRDLFSQRLLLPVQLPR
jgi:3-oxoacyl-ACP reductase-like protein